MARFDELRQLVAAFAPNVPDFVAANAIREAARMFFRQTQSYKVDIEVALCERVNDVLFDLFEDEVEVVSFLSAEHDEFDKLALITSPASANTIGKPRYLLPLNKSTGKVYPTPDKDYYITVKASVRPKFDAASIDDEVFSENEEALRYGALSILKAQNQTDWFSPEEVQYYTDLFKKEVNKKVIEAHNAHSFREFAKPTPKF